MLVRDTQNQPFLTYLLSWTVVANDFGHFDNYIDIIATEELGTQQSTFKASAELPAFPSFSN